MLFDVEEVGKMETHHYDNGTQREKGREDHGLI